MIALPPAPLSLGPAVGLLPDIAEGVAETALRRSTSIIGAPRGPELEALHIPRFVTDFWHRIERFIACPVEIDTSLGLRRVQVLGLHVYIYHADGTIGAQRWWASRAHPQQLVDWPQSSCYLRGAPDPDAWRHDFERGFVIELAMRRRGASREHLRTYGRWAFARYNALISRFFKVDAMARKIEEALSLDPIAQQLAATRSRASYGVDRIAVADYNAAVKTLIPLIRNQ